MESQGEERTSLFKRISAVKINWFLIITIIIYYTLRLYKLIKTKGVFILYSIYL